MLSRRHHIEVAFGVLCLAALYAISVYNYLLFHSLAEIFSIVVACGIFMIAWNTRQNQDNGYLVFLGVAYLHIAGLDGLHTLAYKGMGVIQDRGGDIPTQLWIAARYLESLTLLAAPLLVGRRVRSVHAVALFSTATALLLLAIFFWEVFPVCFVEGRGLTPFKRISEYIIVGLLVVAGGALLRKRSAFKPNVLHYLMASVAFTLLSELFFTFYISVYGLSNLVGHYFKIISFYFIYKAIIETGLRQPYDLLFRELKQREEALRRSDERTHKLVEGLEEGIWVGDLEGRTAFVNPRMAQMLAYPAAEVEGRYLHSFMAPEDAEKWAKLAGRRDLKGSGAYEARFVRKDGESIHCFMRISSLGDREGTHIGSIAAIADITEQKKAEEVIRRELRIKQIFFELIQPLMSQFNSIEETAREVLRQAMRIAESPFGYVSTIEPKTGVMTAFLEGRAIEEDCKLGEGGNELRFLPDAEGRYGGLWGHSLNTRVPFFTNAPMEHPAYSGLPEGHVPIERFLSVPVLLGDRLFGQIALANADRPFSSWDLENIRHLADYYALAVHRRRTEADLRLARDNLEVRVRERTLTLAKAIENLREQMKQRERVEKALRESETKYSTLVEESLMGVYIQQDDRIVFSNERFARIHGYKRDEILGLPSLDLVHPEDRDMVLSFRLKRLRGETAPSEYEARGLTKDGRTIWVTRRISVVTYNGRQAALGNAFDMTEKKAMETALQRSERDLRVLSSQLLSAEENERKRIAQEMHDSIGQSLGAIKFCLENSLQLIESGETGKSVGFLKEIVPLTQKAIEEVRSIVMDLRPSTLDDLGILPTISWFCRKYQGIYSGIAVKTVIGLQEEDVPDPLKTVIYRVLQEALNNIAKHSGADRVILTLERGDGTMELIIEDNGRGFDLNTTVSETTERRGFGLASMRERTELSGGTFFIRSKRGEGTRLKAVWPSREEEALNPDESPRVSKAL